MTLSRSTSLRLGTLGMVALLAAAATSSGETGDVPETKAVNDKQFHDRLLAIAKDYPSYGRVDDEARWALCRAPMPAKAHFSRSSDKNTHGQKLYSLFALNRILYVGSAEANSTNLDKVQKLSGVEQVIVKESWVPEEMKAAEDETESYHRVGQGHRKQTSTSSRGSFQGGAEDERLLLSLLRKGRQALQGLQEGRPLHHVSARRQNAGHG